MDQVRQSMRTADLGYTGLHADVREQSGRGAPANASDSQAAMAALNKLITYAPNSGTPNVAISHAGNGIINVSIPHPALVQRQAQAVQQSITIIQRRIDGSGVLNPTIARQGTDQIVVQLPGVSDPDRVKTLIGTTAHMTFQMVDSSAQPGPIAPLGDTVLPMAERSRADAWTCSRMSRSMARGFEQRAGLAPTRKAANGW